MAKFIGPLPSERMRLDAVPTFDRDSVLWKSCNPNFAWEMTAWERKIAFDELQRRERLGLIERKMGIPQAMPAQNGESNGV